MSKKTRKPFEPISEAQRRSEFEAMKFKEDNHDSATDELQIRAQKALRKQLAEKLSEDLKPA